MAKCQHLPSHPLLQVNAGEVDGMMDNGVRINPLLREMYGSNDETSAIDAMLGLT